MTNIQHISREHSGNTDCLAINWSWSITVSYPTSSSSVVISSSIASSDRGFRNLMNGTVVNISWQCCRNSYSWTDIVGNWNAELLVRHCWNWAGVYQIVSRMSVVNPEMFDKGGRKKVAVNTVAGDNFFHLLRQRIPFNLKYVTKYSNLNRPYIVKPRTKLYFSHSSQIRLVLLTVSCR